MLGNTALTIVARRPDRLTVTVEGDPGGNPQGPIASGTATSAGELPLTVRRPLSPVRALEQPPCGAHGSDRLDHDAGRGTLSDRLVRTAATTSSSRSTRAAGPGAADVAHGCGEPADARGSGIAGVVPVPYRIVWS